MSTRSIIDFSYLDGGKGTYSTQPTVTQSGCDGVITSVLLLLILGIIVAGVVMWLNGMFGGEKEKFKNKDINKQHPQSLQPGHIHHPSVQPSSLSNGRGENNEQNINRGQVDVFQMRPGESPEDRMTTPPSHLPHPPQSTHSLHSPPPPQSTHSKQPFQIIDPSALENMYDNEEEGGDDEDEFEASGPVVEQRDQTPYFENN